MINLLCDTALVYGFADDLPVVSEAVVEQVVADRREMGLLRHPSRGREGSSGGGGEVSVAVEARFAQLEEKLDSLLVRVKRLSDTMEKGR